MLSFLLFYFTGSFITTLLFHINLPFAINIDSSITKKEIILCYLFCVFLWPIVWIYSFGSEE